MFSIRNANISIRGSVEYGVHELFYIEGKSRGEMRYTFDISGVKKEGPKEEDEVGKKCRCRKLRLVDVKVNDGKVKEGKFTCHEEVNG